MDNDKYIGRLLDDRYEILEVIGTGGMAVVYKALCHRLNRMVAIKILKDEFSQDDEFRRRFQAESQAVAMLSHPNIVSVYDVSTAEDADFIVMELIEGISLKQYMEKKGVLNWKETLHFAMQIAKALEHAHGRGIVHRDIKPHNVMVLKNGSVKVADFGIAQVTATNSTMTKEALGSVHYISPEQAKGGRVDNRSDIYSLGIVMYEMIAGRVPFDGDTPVSVAIQHINGGAVEPSYWNPNIPKGLEQIVMKAISRLQKDRYASATAMLYDMDEFRKDPTIVFPPPVPIENESTQVLPGDLKQQAERTIAQKAAGKAVDVPPVRSRQPQEEPEERNRVATIAIASCVLVGIVAIIIFLIVLGQGGNTVSMVEVPSLLGQNYQTLPQFEGIQVVRQGSQHSNFPEGQIIDQSPKAGEQVPPGTRVFVYVSLGPADTTVTMGNLVNRTQMDAQQILADMDLDLDVAIVKVYSNDIAQGRVVKTVPAQGQKLNKFDRVELHVSIGPETVTAKLPNVEGQELAVAEKMLNDAGFFNLVVREWTSDLPVGVVISQSVQPDTIRDVSTEIRLYVSKGMPTEPSTMPTTEPTETTEPSEPSEGTEPTENTQPSEPSTADQVTMEYVFAVQLESESALLSVKRGDEWVAENVEITAEQPFVTLTVTGSGSVMYEIYLDGVFYGIEMVEFGTHE